MNPLIVFSYTLLCRCSWSWASCSPQSSVRQPLPSSLHLNHCHASQEYRNRVPSPPRLWNELPGRRLTSTVSSTEPQNDISGIWQSSHIRAITQRFFREAGPKMTGEKEMLWILTVCGLLVKTYKIQFLREGTCPTGWSLSTTACGIIVLTGKVNLSRNR